MATCGTYNTPLTNMSNLFDPTNVLIFKFPAHSTDTFDLSAIIISLGNQLPSSTPFNHSLFEVT